MNSLGNTLTIMGTGTSAGAPVSFVLVEVESTPLTPGSVSLSFSDGFTNAGDLLDGSILCTDRLTVGSAGRAVPALPAKMGHESGWRFARIPQRLAGGRRRKPTASGRRLTQSRSW